MPNKNNEPFISAVYFSFLLALGVELLLVGVKN